MHTDRELTGTVKWFSGDKGFGFIIPDDGGPDVFLHAEVCHYNGFPMPQPEMRVRFKEERTGKGRKASFIERLI